MQALRHVHLRSTIIPRIYSNTFNNNGGLTRLRLPYRSQPWTRTLTRTSARLDQAGSKTVPSPLPTVPVPVPTWVDKAPAKLQPYLYLARLNSPIGTLLLFYPCTWSITMASYAVSAPWTTPLTYISLFGIGALIMRSAGCTINDMADKDFDKAVDRTKNRPIARGDISRTEAFGFLGVQLSGGLAVLTQLNWYSIFLGASSLPIVALYPFMKRYTYWPQSVLGLAFNWGALLGWSAVTGAVNWGVALPLYAGGFCWTLVYDTIYAHQDKADDVKVGVRSTALLFGPHTRSILTGFSVSAVSLWTLAGYMNAHGLPYYLGVGLAGLTLARILRTVNFDSRPSCWDGFMKCGRAGAWLWGGAIADYVLSVLLGLPTGLSLLGL